MALERKGKHGWTTSIPTNKECLYKVDSPGKTPERNTIYVGLATLYPLPQQRMPL